MSRGYEPISDEIDSEDGLTDYVNGGHYPGRQEYAEAELALYDDTKAIAHRHRIWQRASLKCCFATSFLFLFGTLSVIAMYFFFYDPIMSPLKVYDHVVVGSGPAGSIVARRLADAGKEVLLLEAGGPSTASLGGTDSFDGPLTRFDIPSFWSSLADFSEYHWGGFGTPGIIAGKVLGGSGVENAMLYVRCTSLDVKRWNMTQEWSWESMLDVYLTLEDYCPPSSLSTPDTSSNAYHTVVSPSVVDDSERMVNARPNEIDPVARPFIEAATEFGISRTNDFNAPNGREGVGFFNFNIRGGVRDSVAGRFLAPMLSGRFPLSTTGVSSSTHGGAYQQNTDPADSEYANFDIAIKATVQKLRLSGGGRRNVIRCEQVDKGVADGAFQQEDDSLYAEYLRRVEGMSLLTWVKNFFGGTSLAHNPVPRAFAVTFSQKGVEKTVFLKKPKVSIDPQSGETLPVLGPSVILAAGALGSPKILMNSGIGPVSVLQQAGICARVSSPQVGRNLYDHPTLGMVLSIKPGISAQYPDAYELLSKWGEYTNKTKEWRSVSVKCPQRSGDAANASLSGFDLLSSPGISSGAFITSPYAKGRSKAIGLGKETQPDIQLTVFPTMSEPHMYLIEKYQKKHYTDSNSYTNSKNMLITVSLLDPIGWHVLELNNSSPVEGSVLFNLPEGQSSYLHPLDVKRLAWGVQQVRGILSSSSMSSVVSEELSPGRAVVSDVLDEWIEANVFPNSHWVGSLRMGPSQLGAAQSPHSWQTDILDSVLDERLRVRGVTGVYVAGFRYLI